MQSSNLIKLAPTLSAEERFKIIVKHFHKELEGGKSLLSDLERQAIIKCENRQMWEDYTRRIGIMQWADTFWTKDIETERLRVFACNLILARDMERLIGLHDKAMIELRCDEVKKHVTLLEKSAMRFYAFRDAIHLIERELYGLPLFRESKRKLIESYYEAVDDIFEDSNSIIRAVFEKDGATGDKPSKYLDGYLAKKPIPSKEFIDELVAEIVQIVDSEMEMLSK